MARSRRSHLSPSRAQSHLHLHYIVRLRPTSPVPAGAFGRVELYKAEDRGDAWARNSLSLCSPGGLGRDSMSFRVEANEWSSPPYWSVLCPPAIVGNVKSGHRCFVELRKGGTWVPAQLICCAPCLFTLLLDCLNCSTLESNVAVPDEVGTIQPVFTRALITNALALLS